MCRFLWEHGAALTIRTKDSNSKTLMYSACFKGHPHAAQWLYEVGAVEDIRTKNSDGMTPMYAASYADYLNIAVWLLKWALLRTSMTAFHLASLALEAINTLSRGSSSRVPPPAARATGET